MAAPKLSRLELQIMEALWTEADTEPDPERQAELKKHAHKSNHRYPITSMLALARSDSRIATRQKRAIAM